MAITALFGRHKHRTRKAGDLVKRNPKTVWMRLDNGRTVKRHLVKDRVE